jgi:hypothetical protein
MIFRALDSDQDWRFGSGKASYATTGTAIQFSIETLLRTFQGECFFAMDVGLPWFDLINMRNKDAVVLFIKSIIIEIYGVTKVNEIEYTIDINRVSTIKYDITTLYDNQLLGTVII